jgi:hypothetical protein
MNGPSKARCEQISRKLQPQVSRVCCQPCASKVFRNFKLFRSEILLLRACPRVCFATTRAIQMPVE